MDKKARTTLVASTHHRGANACAYFISPTRFSFFTSLQMTNSPHIRETTVGVMSPGLGSNLRLQPATGIGFN